MLGGQGCSPLSRKPATSFCCSPCRLLNEAELGRCAGISGFVLIVFVAHELSGALDFNFIKDKIKEGADVFRLALKEKSEIPCSFCGKRDSKTRSFSCQPDDCKKLTRWLFEHSRSGKAAEGERVAVSPIRYVV